MRSVTSGSPITVCSSKRWRLWGKQAAIGLSSPRPVQKPMSHQLVGLEAGQVSTAAPEGVSGVIPTDALAAALGLQTDAGVASAASTSLVTTPPRIEASLPSCFDVSPVTVERACHGQLDNEFLKLVRTKVTDTLITRMPVLSVQRNELEDLAHEIALEFATADLGKPMQQLRALLFNLRDSRNPDFVREVVSRAIPPAQLPSMATEDMASAEKRSQRTALLDKNIRENTLAVSTGWKAKRARR